MSADVIELPVRRPSEVLVQATDSGEFEQPPLPPGAVPVDCVTFGQALREIERLSKRLAAAERRIEGLTSGGES